MKGFLLAGLAVTLAVPLAAEAQMTRFEGACVRSVLRHGAVTSADEVASACSCAESALDRNGIGESLRIAKNMYVSVDGEELFEFSAPRYLWDGNGDYDVSDYPWRLSEADKGTRRDDHRRGATQAQSCLSPKFISGSFFFAGSRISRTPAGASATPSGVKILTGSSDEVANLPRLKFKGRLNLDYPPSAQRKREEGAVVLAIKLGTDGRPTGIALVSNESGSDTLAEAALKAVSRLRFLEGQQTSGAFDGTFMVQFRLPPPEPPAPPNAG